MNLLERFRNLPDSDRPLGLHVLFPTVFDFDGDALAEALKSLDTILGKARAEMAVLDAGNLVGIAEWGPHSLKIVYSESPVSASVFEACVRPAQFLEELKADAAKHRSHALLTYAGDEMDPHEQYTALATLAAALARLGAILVLNHAARSAFPAEALLAVDEGESLVESLRALPLLLLYGGFAKIEVVGQEGVWMRTFGGHLLNVPNLAMQAPGHEFGGEIFDLFTSILNYVYAENVVFAAGEILELAPGLRYRFREKAKAEYWLESEGILLVLERI